VNPSDKLRAVPNVGTALECLEELIAEGKGDECWSWCDSWGWCDIVTGFAVKRQDAGTVLLVALGHSYQEPDEEDEE